MKGNGTMDNISKGEKPKQFQSLGFKPKGNFVKKGVPLKGNQPKGNINGGLLGKNDIWMWSLWRGT